MTGIRVRDFVAEDVGPVAELEASIFGDPWSAVAFRDLLAMAHIHGIVAESEGGGLVGYALCVSAADEGEILNLAVAEHVRGSGFGRALLDASLGWLRGRGAATIYLEVRRSNAAAIALYQAAGFATAAVRRGYYRMPTEDAIVMTLASGV